MTKSKLTISPVIFAMALTIAFTVCLKTNVFAAGVRVYLDGNLLTYTEAQPQIISDRTMVPLTETAKHFDMNDNWNAETGIMTFTKDNRVMEHEIFTNVILVNGVRMEYDVTSTIIEDRTLMPVRMLADAIGADVDWDGQNARVLITSPVTAPPANNNQNQNNVGNTPVQPIASLYNVRIPNNNVESGEKVNVVVETNFATSRVRITDGSGNKLAESTTYYDTAAARIFEVELTVDNVGQHTITVAAGNESGYALGNRTATFTVTSQQRVNISRVNPSNPRVDRNEDIDLTVRTSTDAVRVEILDEDNRVVKSRTSPNSRTSSYYEWELTFSISTRGTYDYTIKAYDNNGRTTEANYRIVVGSGSNNTSNRSEAKIIDVDVNDSKDYAQNDRVEVTVITNSDTEKVYIEDSSGRTVATTTRYYNYGGDREWELSWNLRNYSGSTEVFRVFAEDDDGNTVSRTFTLYLY